MKIPGGPAETRSVYAAMGRPAQLSPFTYDDGPGISQPKREAAVMWLRRWLIGDAALVREGTLLLSDEKELRCTATGQVNTSFPDEVSLGRQHLSQAQALAASQ